MVDFKCPNCPGRSLRSKGVYNHVPVQPFQFNQSYFADPYHNPQQAAAAAPPDAASDGAPVEAEASAEAEDAANDFNNWELPDVLSCHGPPRFLLPGSGVHGLPGMQWYHGTKKDSCTWKLCR